VDEGWGGSRAADIQKLCHSAAEELWRHFPGRPLHPIVITRSHTGPIVLDQRLENGEYQVRLDSQDNRWAQFTYQFAHEFGHIVCNYRSGEQPNKWFEEALCELASLFVLRRMAETWQISAPYPNWKDYAPHLKEYADQLIAKSQLPAEKGLADWYRDHAVQLRASSNQREMNRVAAVALLPLFEAKPRHWEAVGYLNAGRAYPNQSFQEYLQDWQYFAPDTHKGFVSEIAALFEIELP
jgi:hypothetical protein